MVSSHLSGNSVKVTSLQACAGSELLQWQQAVKYDSISDPVWPPAETTQQTHYKYDRMRKREKERQKRQCAINFPAVP